MFKYPKEFLKQQEKVEKLVDKLEEERTKLQKLCPHVLQDGSSAFPRSISHSDCTLCGMSDYYLGREEQL